MATSSSVAVTRRGTQLVLHVRVQPGASREGVLGLHGDRIRISVHARPSQGAANHALLRLLARTLRVGRSSLSITSGASRRDKDILIASDLSETELLSRLGLPGGS